MRRVPSGYRHARAARTFMAMANVQGETWRAFGGALSAWVDHNGHSEPIVQGAVDCFRSLELWAGNSTVVGGREVMTHG